MSTDVQRAAAIFGEADEVAMACHVNPDADALGSMLGLSAFLRARGTKTTCSFGNEPLDLPSWAALLPGSEEVVEAKEFPRRPKIMVTLDCASLDRLGPLAGPAGKAEQLVWIDHHVSNDGLGTLPVIDPTASSTAEVVWRIVTELGGEVPTATAICLYAGLVTDTGRFQYGATTPATLRLAADLREHPFDHTRLVQALYEDNRYAYVRLLGTALGRTVLDEDLGLVWTYLTQADLTGAGVHPAETDDLIDLIRTAREADVAAVLKQQRDGRFKVSMRSRGDHDVASVAAAFGGGGHRLAAGYTSRHGLAGTVERLSSAIRGDHVDP